MGTLTYQEVDHSCFIWICHSCGNPNYSSYSLSVGIPIKLFNSFSSISSVQGPDEFQPTQTSSPIQSRHKSNRANKPFGPLRVLVVNCQSAKAKKEFLATCIDSTNPMSSSGLRRGYNNVATSEAFPSNFTSFRKDRNTKDGRGRVLTLSPSEVTS